MRAIMVSGEFPCVRVGKIAEAMEDVQHSVVARKLPPQFEDVYHGVHCHRGATQTELAQYVTRLKGEVIHVHNEPNWPVARIKDVDPRPVIMNVHDVTSARPHQYFDPYEREAYEAADAFVFITDEQRQFVIDHLCAPVADKPYCILPNYGSHSTIVDKPVLPHIGGLCYVGGADPRGMAEAWRDQSRIADAVGHANFHIYPGNPGIDYGTVHETVLDYRLITQRIAQHDWGFVGVAEPNHAWSHSVPNKVYEYMMAGIPFIALNVPLLKPLCDKGYGIYVDNALDVRRAMLEKPAPYAKAVKRDRHRYTMRYNIQPLADLYKQVTA